VALADERASNSEHKLQPTPARQSSTLPYGEGLETGRASTKAPRQSFTRQTWHKVIKSGCKVEDCRLEHGVRLQKYLTLFSIIAVRLMRVTYLARAQPETPATTVFSAAEIEALQIRCDPNPTPQSTPTLREAVRMLGRLGGHLGRKCDKEPGVTVLWRGSMCLYETVETLRAYRRRNSS
jgi:hypothetical protein